MRIVRKFLERRRLEWTRTQMNKHLAGGNALPVTDGYKGGGKSKDKSKRIPKGDSKGGKGGKSGKDKSKEGKAPRSLSQSSNRDGAKEVCKLHLKGKCLRSAADCRFKRNPVCRFFSKGTCTNGANCNFPHVQGPVSAPAVDEAPQTPRGQSKAKAKASPKGSPGGDAGRRRGRSPTPRGDRHAQTW